MTANTNDALPVVPLAWIMVFNNCRRCANLANI